MAAPSLKGVRSRIGTPPAKYADTTLQGQQMANLPYVTAPGNIEKALLAVKSAAVPERVSQDFVKTILQVKGGSGNQMTSFMKKIGFVNADGAPSDLYKKFRNPASSGQAAAEALRIGFAPLYVRNEYMHKLSEDQLRGIVLEETGQGEDSSAIPLVLAAIKYLKKFADFSGAMVVAPEAGSSLAHRPLWSSPSQHRQFETQSA